MPSSEDFEKVHGVFTRIARSYDLMNDLESLGLHRLWKARLVRELSRAQPRRILDVACGTGDIALALARANPEAEVTGLDFNESMLEIARRRAARELPLGFVVKVRPEAVQSSPATAARAEESSGAQCATSEGGASSAETELRPSCRGVWVQPTNRLRFVLGNALELPYADGSIDAVSISFGLRNMPSYASVLAEIYRVLRPGGRFRCLEASYPEGRLVRPPFRLYFKYWLPVLGKLVVDSPGEYSWLNTSTEAFLSKGELAELMRQTGFTQVSYTSFLLGAAALHRGCKHRVS
ncbi:MAG: class I SAM-dependent methyltransferase [Coriobacteriales bacterium]|nr:class I SAM-dependent methyltransferase [Coriobacteriales bacterium]